MMKDPKKSPGWRIKGFRSLVRSMRSNLKESREPKPEEEEVPDPEQDSVPDVPLKKEPEPVHVESAPEPIPTKRKWTRDFTKEKGEANRIYEIDRIQTQIDSCKKLKQSIPSYLTKRLKEIQKKDPR